MGKGIWEAKKGLVWLESNDNWVRVRAWKHRVCVCVLYAFLCGIYLYMDICHRQF